MKLIDLEIDRLAKMPRYSIYSYYSGTKRKNIQEAREKFCDLLLSSDKFVNANVDLYSLMERTGLKNALSAYRFAQQSQAYERVVSGICNKRG